MARWYLAPSLNALLAEVDARWPARSRASDGTIGDLAHSARTSDHNPKPDGAGGAVVDALDLTNDPVHWFYAHSWARDVAARGDERVKYLISSGEIWNPSTTAWATYRRLRAEGHSRRDAARMALPGWRRYTGSNPHVRHAHVSVKPGGRRDTSSWFDAAPPAPAPAAPIPAPTLEVDVNIESHHIEMPLDDQGRGNLDAPWPIERIISFLAHSEVRPNIDGRYDNVANTVTFTPNGTTTVVVVQGGTPGGRAHLWLRVAA